MSTSVHRNTPSLKAVDPRGLTVRTVEYHRVNVTDTPRARVTRQVYGASGFLLEQWDPRQFARGTSGVASHSSIYSLSGEAVRTESADAGWRLVLRGEAGQQLHTWDSRVAHQEHHYDRSLRPVAVFEQAAQEPRPRCVERFTYAAAVPAETAGNRCGRLIRHADPAGVLRMDEYGVGGSVIQQTRQFRADTSPGDWPSSDEEHVGQLEPQAHTTRWRYDAVGALLEQTDAKGNRQHRRYGMQGRLKEVALTLKEGTRKVLMDQRVYNASGQVESERAGNEVTKVAKYAAEDNRLLQLTVCRKGQAATPLQDLVYAYDPVGNILSLRDLAQPTQWHSNTLINAFSNYQYDSLYQLIQASGRENAGNSGGQAYPGQVRFGATDRGLWRNYTQQYTYDESGNLTRLSHLPSSGTGYTRDMGVAAGSNRAVSVIEGASGQWATLFDANGNQQALGSQQLAWNVRNQLSHATQVPRAQGTPDVESYIYDGQGQRAIKVRSQEIGGKPHTQRTFYLPGVQLHQHKGKRYNLLDIETGGGQVTVVQWEVGRPSEMSAEHLQFSLLDHLNSSSLELDEQARLLSQEYYYPYGATAWWASNGTLAADYKLRRYSGKERDATGLYYYGSRYYAPWLQRWVSPDPMGDMDGLNLYTMALGNPLRFRDVDGMQASFGEQFQPSRGDIIFGKGSTVTSYRSFWSKLTARGDAMVTYFGVEEMGAAMARLKEKLIPIYVQYGKGRLTDDEFEQQLQVHGAPIAQQFYDAIKSKYAGCTSTAANREFAKKFVSDYSSDTYSFEETLLDYGMSLSNFERKLVSRASKSALKTLTDPQSIRQVHFALDHLDMAGVINKTETSFAGSELRWLYRHRSRVPGHVTFYRQRQQVEAPWKSNPTLWRRYKPSSSRGAVRATR
ncbi:sugar-binding protein [Pseudomonas sp. NS1(2017)]|uniref:RHS repeat-associated core domain-containing protein n=1 Tax=Pseudomonas sp. NS1(2017) TaxID=2025658 RepID=UPI000BA27D34|nr:RHS repeat-associated core domain-containing protein [Pseudomonas sp. NS1(2017)]ASV39825.1 sugar-binding protein [Pseudomonas sp. NS1(2017)]